MQEEIKIQDESGDKEFFSMIPNFIVNHSSHWEKSLYLTLKRIAGEKGSCWTSPDNLAKIEKCSPNRIRKTLEQLVRRKWIEKVGKKGKTKPTNEYIIVNIWGLNSEYYSKKESSPDEQSKRKFTQRTKKVHPVNLVTSPRETKKNTKEDLLRRTTSADVGETKPKRGNEDINFLIDFFKDTLNLKLLDGTVAENRRYCWLALRKFKKEGVKMIIKAAAQDDFWANKITSFKSLYYKGVQIASSLKVVNNNIIVL